MTELKMLLELRTKIKSKKSDFIRQDYQRRKRLGRKLNWRKPKGIHSKIRHHLKGRRKMPSPGYKSPFKVRGLHQSGLKIVNISSVSHIDKIKKDTEGIVISRQVGMKKKFEILKRAKEAGITILNANIDEQITKIEDFLKSKEKKTKAKDARKGGTKENEVAIEQKGIGELSEKQKRDAEKHEKDKLLTKKV